jgi:hypothetical protein
MKTMLEYLPPWKTLLKRLVNMGSFYGGWFVCMHEATGPRPFLGPALVAVLLVYHLAVSHIVMIDILLIASLAIFGTIVDSVYVATGLISFKGGYQNFPHLAPLWITSLWALYASSVNHSLEWLRAHYLLVAAPLGAGGAISSYLVGEKLGAATFHYPYLIVFSVIGLVWACVVPLSLLYSDWLMRKR